MNVAHNGEHLGKIEIANLREILRKDLFQMNEGRNLLKLGQQLVLGQLISRMIGRSAKR